MATVVMPAKNARMDIRMNEEQKETIARAAAASGMSISQWALDRLMSSARSDLLETSVASMSARAFDEFSRMLEEPNRPEFDEFVLGKTIWE